MQKKVHVTSALALLSILMLLLTTAGQAMAFGSSNDEEILTQSSRAISNIVKKVRPAVVYIQVEKTVGAKSYYDDDFFNNPFFERFFGPYNYRQQPQQRRKQLEKAQGTGFLISRDGYILTNNHVVEDADKITVTLPDKKTVEAKLIGTDPKSDVALIKVKDGNNLPFLQLGNSDDLEVGEWVIAIGNPFGLSQTVTVGVVSAKGRSGVGLNEYENFIQTDAAINPGNSGGPLINIHGQVIGINSAIYSRSGGYMGIGFAIPINMVKEIKDQLLSSGKVTRGWLGVAIQDVSEDLAKSFGLNEAKGILLSEVNPKSPADKAGLKRGDILIKMDGKELESVNQLRNRIALTTPKTKVRFDIIRDGKPKTIEVTIGTQPAKFDKESGLSGESSNYLEDFGLSFQELTPELARQLGFDGAEGILVGDVKEGSIAASAGLEPGMLISEINKAPVHSLDDLDNVLSRSNDKKRLLLRVRTGQYSQYVVLVAE